MMDYKGLTEDLLNEIKSANMQLQHSIEYLYDEMAKLESEIETVEAAEGSLEAYSRLQYLTTHHKTCTLTINNLIALRTSLKSEHDTTKRIIEDPSEC